MKYEVIEANSREELTELVTENFANGWVLKGGVSVDNGMFYQAMGHPSDGAGKPKSGDSGVCGICGKAGCTSKLHAKLERIASMTEGFAT